jgi:hypothetical protein
MQKWYNRRVFFISLGSVVIFFIILLFVKGRNPTFEKADGINHGMEMDKVLVEETPSYVKYISFQNSDSTWGFTVFLNSRPYLHHKRIPFRKSETGFQSKKDAENVAELFVNKIRNGDLNPELNKNLIDSLGIIMN